MRKKDDSFKAAIGGFLRNRGFEVRELDRLPDAKSADLIATKSQRYLIELKERGDDLARVAAANELLAHGKIVGTSDTAGYKNRASGIISEGVKQLRARHDVERDFQLLWLHSTGLYPDVKMRQFCATLYGTTNIADLDGDGYHRPCYYFYNSDFFRYRKDLDGAVLSAGKDLQLCVNNLSSRVLAFRKSELASAFTGGIVDPEVKHDRGEAYIPDPHIDRRDPEVVLQHLRQKYGRSKLINIDLGYMSVEKIEEGDTGS
jgi:hypothetical protein